MIAMDMGYDQIINVRDTTLVKKGDKISARVAVEAGINEYYPAIREF